ncbi:MAG: hypothetical protein WDA16_08195 [Candidatus Thermoplasmatota archaeon]
MRLIMSVIAITAVMWSPMAAASVPHPQALVVNEFPSGTMLLTWTPVVGATMYIVFRGPTVDDMVAVDRTPNTFYVDDSATSTDHYMVVSMTLFGHQSIQGGSSGDCVTTSTSTYQVAVAPENCIKFI